MSLGSSVHDAYARLADALNQSDEAQAIARKLRIPPPLLPAIVMGTSLVVIVVLVLDFYASVLAGFLCWIYPTLATMRLLLKHIDYEKGRKKQTTAAFILLHRQAQRKCCTGFVTGPYMPPSCVHTTHS